MNEAHKLKFLIHPGVMNMYRDLRLDYWCPCIKWDVAWYVESYLTSQKFKAKHQRPHGKLHTGYSHVEIGADFHGLHSKFTMDNTWDRFDLGHHGSIDQECTLHPYLGEYFSREVDRYLHS